MSHYAFVSNGVVTQVIIANTAPTDGNNQPIPGWYQTSFNTTGNVHRNPQTGEDDSAINPPLRGNFATVGSIYDSTHDVFYAPQPGPSFVLDTTHWLWTLPGPTPPNDGNIYQWSFTSNSFVRYNLWG